MQSDTNGTRTVVVGAQLLFTVPVFPNAGENEIVLPFGKNCLACLRHLGSVQRVQAVNLRLIIVGRND